MPHHEASRSPTRRPFLVCIHDATPAYARETRMMIRDLTPLVGRRFSVGVVPNWCGKWPLSEHPSYCQMVREGAEELLLHGYFHQRQRGSAPISWLTGRADELNGLDVTETRQTLERGQRDFVEVFGQPARGFVAPAWQRGHVRLGDEQVHGLTHVLGFFALESASGQRIPVATSTWDCGRWGWLGHLGRGIGRLSQSLNYRVPALAIHPRDLERGFWPEIVRVTQAFIEEGYEPITLAGLLEAKC